MSTKKKSRIHIDGDKLVLIAAIIVVFALLYPFLSLRSGTKRNENVSLSLFFLYNSSCREHGILPIARR